MLARIYQPARNAMQSGQANTHHWVLEFVPADAKVLDPLMGWTGSSDMTSQVRLRFGTKEEALRYCEENGIQAVVQEPHARKPNIRARGYGENFVPDRRGPWTH